MLTEQRNYYVITNFYILGTNCLEEQLLEGFGWEYKSKETGKFIPFKEDFQPLVCDRGTESIYFIYIQI